MRPLTRSHRGLLIRRIENEVVAAAKLLGVDAAPRFLRLLVASDKLGRQISSFNELSDPELQGLARWSENKDAVADIVRKATETTIPLFQETP